MQELGKKLQLKQAHQVLAFQAPSTFIATLTAEGYSVTANPTALPGTADAVQLFVHDKTELDQLAPEAVAALKPEGLLWIAYPKKSSGVTSDLTRDDGWRVLANFGYEPVRQVAIDDTWSSLRFRHKSDRKTPSKFGAVYEGIDKEARTVIPPDDLREALEQSGLRSSFETLAFTHKKEMVVSLLEAKRPETRANRVQKALELVKKLSAKT